MNIFWALMAHKQIGDAKAEAQSAGRSASNARDTARETDARLDRVLLVTEAVWSFVSEKLDLTDDDLINRINEIDLRDGKLDGKVTKTPRSCPSCQRTIGPRFNRCIYCGQPVMHDPFAS